MSCGNMGWHESASWFPPHAGEVCFLSIPYNPSPAKQTAVRDNFFITTFKPPYPCQLQAAALQGQHQLFGSPQLPLRKVLQEPHQDAPPLW